jgi:hypothetical protein
VRLSSTNDGLAVAIGGPLVRFPPAGPPHSPLPCRAPTAFHRTVRSRRPAPGPQSKLLSECRISQPAFAHGSARIGAGTGTACAAAVAAVVCLPDPPGVLPGATLVAGLMRHCPIYGG